jgi:hypothetical protein
VKKRKRFLQLNVSLWPDEVRLGPGHVLWATRYACVSTVYVVSSLVGTEPYLTSPRVRRPERRTRPRCAGPEESLFFPERLEAAMQDEQRVHLQDGDR